MLESLEQKGIRCCVLRNYEFLLEQREPNASSEKSVDLLISGEDASVAEQTFISLGFEQRQPQFSRSHKAYFQPVSREMVSFDVQVGGIHWNDLCYLPASLVLERRKNVSFFFVPSDEDTVVMLLVHSIFGKRYFKEEYQKRISELLATVDAAKVQEQLDVIFPKAITKKITRKILRLAQEGKYQKILRWKSILILFFIFRSFRNTLTFTFLLFRWLRWKRLFHSWPLVSIVGPDGAGKSTAAVVLAEHLQGEGRKARIVYHGRGRGQLLPIRRLGNAYKRKEKINKNNEFWRKKAWYSAAAIVFTGDLLLRYAFRIFPMRKRRTFVITDRYGSDIMLMPHVSPLLKKLLWGLFPKPTLTFYLWNTPDVLLQRRPQESEKGLERQLAYFEQFLAPLHPIRIKTTNTEKDHTAIIQEVMRYGYKRWY